ncbi:MAG: HNH endonuclease [Candidatus Brocadiia bacterium]
MANNTQSFRCIYCLENKDISNFYKTEHVIPKLYGVFDDNLTLNIKNKIGVVCNECNQYFGDNFELFLGRDTIEGLWRFKEGLKKTSEFEPFKNNRRLKCKIVNGNFKNAYVKFRHDQETNLLAPFLITQVGFTKASGEMEFFELHELPTKEELKNKGFVINGGIDNITIIGSREEVAEISNILKFKGIKLKEGHELKPSYPGNVVVGVESIVDKKCFRGYAKIAFNYLAYYSRDNDIDLPFNNSFDGVRKFIREGVDDGFQYVYLDNKPILWNEKSYSCKGAEGHIITLEWDLNKEVIFTRLRLNNIFGYKIILCKKFIGIWREILVGHHFNAKTMRVKELSSGNRIIPPPSVNPFPKIILPGG